MELNFDEIFIRLIRAMKITQSYPYTPRDWRWAMYFFIIHGIYTTGFLLLSYNVVNYDLKSKNYSKACRNGILVLAYFINTFQTTIITCYRDSLVSLIQAMKKDYKSKIPSDINIMRSYANQGSKFCNLWMMIIISGGSTFFIKNIGFTLYFCMTDACRLVHVYDVTYPNPVEEYKNNIFVYIITYAHFLYIIVYSCINYLAFVPLIPIFTLHACGQFDIVKQNIDNLFQNSKDEAEVREKLKNIVMQLQDIYSLVDRMKKCFKGAIEFTLKSGPLFLPISYYEITESYHRGEMSVEFLAFIVGAAVICTSWCSYSDLLMEKGEDITLAAYSCGWETRLYRRTRSTLVLVMMRAQRPVALRAMFRNICFDTLTDIMKQSYAIFNLMNTVWN